MRVLIDTNIILDFVLARQPFFPEADEIFFHLKSQKFDGYVSPVTPINVFYVTRKEKDKDTAFVAVEELLNLSSIEKQKKDTLTLFPKAYRNRLKFFNKHHAYDSREFWIVPHSK